MLRTLGRLNRALVALLQVLLVAVFLFLVVDVLWGVGSRYLFGNQAAWSEELARLLMVWLVLLGAALASREERHLGLDVVVRSWSKDLQRWAKVTVWIVVTVFAFLVMLWGGWQLVVQRFDSGQTMPALGIAKGWFYLALPVSGLLITLFSLESLGSILAAGRRIAKEAES
ncbi:MAG: TRAP transporter small permease [Verrucomicrobiota bacterium]